MRDANQQPHKTSRCKRLEAFSNPSRRTRPKCIVVVQGVTKFKHDVLPPSLRPTSRTRAYPKSHHHHRTCVKPGFPFLTRALQNPRSQPCCAGSANCDSQPSLHSPYSRADLLISSRVSAQESQMKLHTAVRHRLSAAVAGFRHA